MNREWSQIFALVLTIACMAGCNTISSQRQALNAQEASVLAANFANDECERLYKSRPFTSDNHIPESRDDRWYWGRLDQVGHNGLSAKVTFDLDGSDEEVKVYYSSDTISIPVFEAVGRPVLVPRFEHR